MLNCNFQAEKKVKLPKPEKKTAEEPAAAEAKKTEDAARRDEQAEKTAKAEADAKKKADEESKKMADAKQKAELEAKQKAEADAKKKSDEAARQKADEDANKKAEANQQAEEDARRKTAAETQQKAEDEAKALVEAKKVAEKPPTEAKKDEEKPKKKKIKKERSATVESMRSEASSVQLPKAADVLPPPPVPEIAEDMQAVEEEEAKVRRERKQRKGFAILPESEYAAVRGDDVPVECEVFNEDTEVRWLVNGKPVSDDRFVIFADGYIRRLTIRKIELEDHGISVAASADGEEFQTSITVDDTLPEFVEKLERKATCIAGKTLTLAVQLSHVGQPITWTYEGEPISESDPHYAVRIKGTKHELQVLNCTYEDAGRYAASLNGIETSTVVDIHGKPLIRRVGDEETKTIVVDANESLVMHVDVVSVPDPDVTILVNNEKVPPEMRTTMEMVNESVSICRRKMRKGDAGEYVVRLSNEYGEEEERFNVTVRGRRTFILVTSDVGLCWLLKRRQTLLYVWQRRYRCTG